MYDLFDLILSAGLEVDVDTYNDVINNKCTNWEAKFIIFVFLSSREDKFEKARAIFNSYLIT